jgi:hypothetical protein
MAVAPCPPPLHATGVDGGRTASLCAFSLGLCDPFQLSLLAQVGLELCEDANYIEERLACRRRCVDRLLSGFEVHASSLRSATRFCKSRSERARRSMRVTISVSPARRKAIKVCSSVPTGSLSLLCRLNRDELDRSRTEQCSTRFLGPTSPQEAGAASDALRVPRGHPQAGRAVGGLRHLDRLFERLDNELVACQAGCHSAARALPRNSWSAHPSVALVRVGISILTVCLVVRSGQVCIARYLAQTVSWCVPRGHDELGTSPLLNQTRSNEDCDLQ